MTDIVSGAEFSFPYPFVRTTYEEWDGEGYGSVKAWMPGVDSVDVYPDDSGAVADGVGKQIVTVVSVHKPGKYPERVFYTRKWETPDGVVFGKPGLKMKTVTAFKRLIAGYAYEYEMRGS